MHLFHQFQTSEELDNNDFSLHQSENENSNENNIRVSEVPLICTSIIRYWSCI